MRKETRQPKQSSQKRHTHNRAALLFGLIMLFGIFVCGRLFWVQVVRGGEFAEMDMNQTEENRPIQSPRGTIYDRNGKVLAVSTVVQSMYADPKVLNRSPEALADILLPYMDIKREDLIERLHRDTRFVWLERLLDKSESDAIKNILQQEKIEGIYFVEESKRYYPNGNLLAQVLGFVGIDDKGLDGIESVVDSMIRGDSVNLKLTTSRHGVPILESNLAQMMPDKERSVYLTIDANIQFFAERALDRAMGRTKSAGGTIIVMDPRTGEILAMASRPTYDPNHFTEWSETQFRNRAVVNLYEPGSTFKPIIAAAALASGTVTPDTVFHDTGAVHASGHVIKNWDEEGYGDVRLEDIIKHSINTGFAELGLKVGGAVLTDYAKRFGFGKKTGIELPGEGSGILFNPEDMRASDTATMSIGQSIAVTPLQMIQAYGALANDGQMMKPHVIDKVKNPDGSVYKDYPNEKVGEPISKQVAQTLMPMLEKVVSEGGGIKARVPGYRLAGKTGTAQKLDTVHGGYLDGRYIASFIGFGPIERPEVVCLVVLDDPEGVYYGGQIAAPVFAEVMTQIMRYKGLHPTVSEAFTGKELPPIEKELPVRHTESGEIVVPNLVGRRLREVLDWGQRAGVTIVPQGDGVVVNQTPSAGLALTDTKVDVYLQ